MSPFSSSQSSTGGVEPLREQIPPQEGLPLAVCPACRFGFPDTTADADAVELVCPRSECGHRWELHGQTIRAAHGHERRSVQPELRVVSGESALQLELPEGETFIGRDPECRFRLDNLSVSRRHARIVRQRESTWLEDLGSSWGTQLNGRPVTERTLLTACDRLLIGGVTLEYAIRFDAAESSPQVVNNSLLIARAADFAPLVAGAETQSIELTKERLTFGRSRDRDVVLPATMISGRHALLQRESDGCYLYDTQSRIGTHVNGKSIIRARLEAGDRVQIGPFLFRFEGRRLVRVVRSESFAVVAETLTQTAGSVTLLDGIGFVFKPGEFVGLLGPSGAGKTTLLDALNGLRPARQGRVLVNGESLYDEYDRLRHHIGYVPQEDIIHAELTVRQALTYAARLRLPRDLSDSELAELIGETLETLDLTHRGDVPIARLSGGQRKRASVGVELLSKPGILFLDEPTSGLDPATESRLMRKFRQLADQGRTVICTTHVMENVDLFHKVVVLAPGGRLAYFGPPLEAKRYFEIDRFTSLYDRMEDKPADQWKQQYLDSPLGRELQTSVGSEESQKKERRRQQRIAPAPRSSAVAQCTTLTRRFLTALQADKTNLAILLAQPLVIAGLVCLVCRELPAIFFLLVISALWFGCSSAAQQIVKERPIYRRERMVNLRLDAYLLSKFLPLAGISAFQSALMLGTVWLFEDYEGSLLIHFFTLLLAAWNGVAMGLIISALAANADKAMSVVPLSLIPQIILAGTLVAFPDMNAPTRAISYLVSARWANQAVQVGLLEGRAINSDLLAETANVTPLWNLYPDYDFKLPDERLKFLMDKQDTRVTKTDLLAADWGVLVLFLGGELAAVTVILRRQDPF